jgi:hypothetical protein
VVGRTSAVLGGALFAALLVYYETSEHWWNAGVWWDVAWIACVLMPATFALVLLALPLRTWRWVGAAGAGFAVLAAILTVANADVLANFARLAAASLLGFWFLGLFEAVSWVVLVACIIPWVDAYSVWRGPTKQIVAHHEHVFTVLSFAYPVPGEHASANLGMPDLLFFALFLGAAARFQLRVYWTWVCLVAALGITIALTVWWDLSGLPALPAVAIGFLVPNADLLWRAVRRREPEPQEPSPGSETART